LDEVVDFLKVDAALTEQTVGLAALGSSRFFVDVDAVFHLSYLLNAILLRADAKLLSQAESSRV
jgi:hypothetical protein